MTTRQSQLHHRHQQRWLYSLLLLASVSLWLSGCSFPTATPHVYRVGMMPASGPFLEIAEGFKAGMTELGYIEGETIIYDYQELDTSPDAYERATQRMLENQVDLIFAFPTPSAIAAKAVTQGTDTPVVFAHAGIEGSHLVDSVREPGGNITGVRYPGPELISKRLEILLEIAPHVKRIWLAYELNHPNSLSALEVLRPAAAVSGLTLVEIPATSSEELMADLAARSDATDIGLDAIMLLPDGVNNTVEGQHAVLTFAAEQHVPVVGNNYAIVEQGALFGYSSNLFHTGKLAAPLVDKVLHGTPAGSIPLVTPESDLWINYQVAQELGLTVPEGLLKQATEVIR